MSAEKVDELSVIVNKLSEKIDAINTKIKTLAPVPRRAEAHNETVGPDPSFSSNVNQRENPELDLDPDLSAASPVDVSQEFELVRDRLSKVSISTQYRVHDSSAGIKQDCKPTLKVLSKCARFAETGLKQLSLITPDADGVCHINQGDLQALFTIFAAQSAYLKGEYFNLVVRSSFSAETSRIFRAFENNTSTFSESSLRNIRVAAELSALSTRTGSTPSNFAPRRGFPRRRNGPPRFWDRNPQRGHHSPYSSDFPVRREDTTDN